MERLSARRKSLRRKYKRYAAAAIGAAIMTGAALPGIPAISKALAAEKIPSPPAINEQANIPNRDGWHEHKYDWPSPDDTQGWVENGHIYYRNDRDNQLDESMQTLSPIDVLKDAAEKYGFDPSRDSFSILRQSRHRATIQVTKSDTGQQFKVNLEKDAGDWQVVVVRGIGDANFPATYYVVES